MNIITPIKKKHAFVTWTIILSCLLFFIISCIEIKFLYKLSFVANMDAFLYKPYSIITSMFMHGSFFHMFFNCLVLWAFGPKVEHTIGSIRMMFMFLVSGIIGTSISLYYLNNDSMIIGASGAIAGIIAAHYILYANERLEFLLSFFVPITQTIINDLLYFTPSFLKKSPFNKLKYIFIILFPVTIKIRTYVIIFICFNILYALIDYFSINYTNIAWYSHFGGFISGYIIMKLFNLKLFNHSEIMLTEP